MSGLSLLGVGGALSLCLSLFLKQRRKPNLKRTGFKIGLKPDKDQYLLFNHPKEMSGSEQEHTITINLEQKTLSITSEQPYPSQFKLNQSSANLQTKDKDFDHQFALQADDELALSYFDQETRLRLLQLPKLSFNGQTFLVQKACTPHQIRILINISKHFLRQDTNVLLLEKLNDTETEIRSQTLDLLAKYYPTDTRTLQNLRLYQDKDMENQLKAIKLSGKDPIEILKAIAQENFNSRAPQVIEQLSKLNDPRAKAAIREVLQKTNLTTDIALAAIKALSNDPDAAKLISAFSKKKIHRTINLACLQALMDLNDQEHLWLFSEHLHSQDPEVFQLALKGLTKLGTIAQVQDLIMAKGQRKTSREIRAIEQTITQIQSRLENVERGWLSIETQDGGELSIVENKEGCLSPEAKDLNED